MKPLLVLRPQPGADATARRAIALGLETVTAPLFEIRPLKWDAPDPALFDALLVTSANAIRHGGEMLARYRYLPLFAVGTATAEAAHAAGFADIIPGQRDGMAAVDLAVARGKIRLLHLAGREHVDLRHPDVTIARRLVYAADAVETLPDAARAVLTAGGVVLLHSARAAALFATLADAADLPRARTTVIALSDAIRDAAGSGWAKAVAAPVPNDEALLEIAARLCNQGANGSGGTGSGEARA
jgi:uroporphyrinogen-III synthase